MLTKFAKQVAIWEEQVIATTNYTVSFWIYDIATFNSGFKLSMAKS